MKNWTRAALVLVLLFAAIACSKDSESDIPDTRGGLMVFQMIPGDVKFDVMLDTVTLGSNMAFGDNTGSYKEFRAQKYNLFVYLAGNHTAPIMGGELNLRHGKNLSAFLTVDHNDTLQVFVTEDDNTPSTIAGNARMRVINLSDPYRKVGTGNNQQQLPLDFYLEYVDKKSVPVFKSLTYGTVTEPAEIRAGNRRLDINWVDSSKILQSVSFRADSGKVYTMITTGDPRTANFKLWQYAR